MTATSFLAPQDENCGGVSEKLLMGGSNSFSASKKPIRLPVRTNHFFTNDRSPLKTLFNSSNSDSAVRLNKNGSLTKSPAARSVLIKTDFNGMLKFSAEELYKDDMDLLLAIPINKTTNPVGNTLNSNHSISYPKNNQSSTRKNSQTKLRISPSKKTSPSTQLSYASPSPHIANDHTGVSLNKSKSSTRRLTSASRLISEIKISDSKTQVSPLKKFLDDSKQELESSLDNLTIGSAIKCISPIKKRKDSRAHIRILIDKNEISPMSDLDITNTDRISSPLPNVYNLNAETPYDTSPDTPHITASNSDNTNNTLVESDIEEISKIRIKNRKAIFPRKSPFMFPRGGVVRSPSNKSPLSPPLRLTPPQHSSNLPHTSTSDILHYDSIESKLSFIEKLTAPYNSDIIAMANSLVVAPTPPPPPFRSVDMVRIIYFLHISDIPECMLLFFISFHHLFFF